MSLVNFKRTQGVYEDGETVTPASTSSTNNFSNKKFTGTFVTANDSDDSEMEDYDMTLDINKLTAEHKAILNKCATQFGMQFGDFIRMIIMDNEEKEQVKQNKQMEAEKAMHSGRKSRRQRRIAKERRLKERGEISPPRLVS